MTVTRRVLILIAALVQTFVMSILLYASYWMDLHLLRDVDSPVVHPATRADIDSPFSWRISWSQWALKRGGAHVSFAPDTDDPQVLSQLRAVRGAKVRLSEHWFTTSRCDDLVDSETEEKVAFLRWPFGDMSAFIELPVAYNLCTHMKLTLIESEPRAEIKTLNAIVRGETDDEIHYGASVGMAINSALLILGLVSTCALAWACCAKSSPGVDEIRIPLGPKSPS